MHAMRQKHKFVTLDAIRGIAAICVMGFHYALLDQRFPVKFSNAFIDVDLFFCLSGFVLMRAYGEWAEGSRGVFDFVKIRFVRLYPMYAVGTVIGIITFLTWSALSLDENQASLMVSLLLSALMLPDLSGTVNIPFSIANGIYPFNVPAWSLIFEMLANIALVTRRWNQVSLMSLTAVAGIALALVATSMQGVNGGFTASTMIIGLLRVSYNFAVGALLMRFYQRGLLVRVALPSIFPIVSVIFISAVLPSSGRIDIAIILFAIPLIIASATWDPQSRWALAIFAWLGRISYPLYAIHYPLVLLAMQMQWMHVGRVWLIGTCAVVAILLSDMLARTLDPIARQILSQALMRRSTSATIRSSECAEKI